MQLLEKAEIAVGRTQDKTWVAENVQPLLNKILLLMNLIPSWPVTQSSLLRSEVQLAHVNMMRLETLAPPRGEEPDFRSVERRNLATVDFRDCARTAQDLLREVIPKLDQWEE